MMDLTANLAALTRRAHAAAHGAGRDPAAITLLAVSKTQPPPAIQTLLTAGHRAFAENRVQEAKEKFTPLRALYPDLALHLIGPLQTNKVKDAVALFDVIQTLDRPALAEKLATEMARQDRFPSLYIQVNTGHEPQKAGVLPEALPPFLQLCRDRFGLKIDGLMCLPPAHEAPRTHFLLLQELARQEGLAKVSMGMSDDFEEAIACGATEVRLGTALFGSRTPLAGGARDP